jgi:diguanylate cyclase (GGDEF)-like protein
VNPDVEKHLSSLVNFPSPPGVATRIIEIARDPDVELSTVSKALEMDSALSSKILRIANSAFYAQRRKTASLHQALVVLGLNATLTLALSFSLVKYLHAGKANGLDYPLYWRRVLLAATAARALADALHHPLAEEIFLAALLQDIGMLALDQAVPDLYGDHELQRDHVALADFEARRLGADHAQIGGWLMRQWNLPDRLNRAISQSHRLDESFTTDPDRIFERCVALSGPIADLFLLDAEARPFEQTAQRAERSLGLDKLAFGQVLGTIGALIPETAELFESQSLAGLHPELILEQAREVLMLRSLHALPEIHTLRAAAESATSRVLKLEEETRRDALTGVCNRAYLDQALAREFENAARHKRPLSVAFADLDGFKGINDRFGHQAGDRVLQATARILRSNTRQADLIARYGGEEFVVMLPATDAATARLVCERLVAAFQNTEHAIGADHARVTISIGCATHDAANPFENAAELINAADQALYTAKLRGRNRSVPFDPHNPAMLARLSG